MIQKRIGKVEIYEVVDNKDMESTMRTESDNPVTYFGQTSALLMNVARARTLDSRALDSLVNIFWHPTKKTGILLKKDQRNLNLTQAENKHIEIFMDFEDVIRKWGNDFTEEGSAGSNEQRLFTRLSVALPVQFGLLINGRAHKDCFAVVTNLSAAGLYARFIDSYSEAHFKKLIQRSFSKLVDVELQLEQDLKLEITGILSHQYPDGRGLGVEFWDISTETQRTLFNWLYEHEKNTKEKSV